MVACLDRATICEGTARLLIAARLQQNINDITILIHGTPEILLPAVDSDEEFVQIPGVTEAALFLLKTSDIVGSEFPAPLADGFVRNNYSAMARRSSTSRKLKQKR